MDQQHAFSPATGRPDIPAGESGLPEAHTSAAAEVMLARADEARRLFAELLSASPGTALAASGEQPVLDGPGHDGTGEAGRPWPSWMQRLRLRMQGRRFAADALGAAEDAHG